MTAPAGDTSLTLLRLRRLREETVVQPPELAVRGDTGHGGFGGVSNSDGSLGARFVGRGQSDEVGREVGCVVE